MFIMMYVACALAVQDAQPTETGSAPALDPVIYDILRNADEAAKALTTIRYDAEYEGTGSQAVVTPLVTGQITLVKSDFRVQNLKVDFTTYRVQKLEGAITKKTGLFHRRGMILLDHTERVAIEGNGSLRSLGSGNNLYLSEFSSSNPYDDEINANQVTLEGRTYVKETLCDVLLVDYDGRSRSRWFFGVDDHLPRRIERLRNRDGVPGARILTISNLELNFEVDDSVFALEIPEGYSTRFMAPRPSDEGFRTGRIRPDGP